MSVTCKILVVMLNKKNQGENNIDWFKDEIKKEKKIFCKRNQVKNLKLKEKRLNLKPKQTKRKNNISSKRKKMKKKIFNLIKDPKTKTKNIYKRMSTKCYKKTKGINNIYWFKGEIEKKSNISQKN